MTAERVLELKTQLLALERTMRPLEWDLKQNQINEFRKIKLESLRKEHAVLLDEIRNLEPEC